MGGDAIAGFCGCGAEGVASEGRDSARATLKTGLVADSVYKRHDTGPGHPEGPGRCDVVVSALRRERLTRYLETLEPRVATETELELCHTREYIRLVEREAGSGVRQLSTGDTAICRETFEVARYAVGGVLAAVDAVATGRVKNAFCVVRPPGHHASAARGMGFCVFNNVAVAARYAQRRHKLARVLVVDWDVHHGNGTQDIFYGDGSVLYFSTHQWPLYPGTGRPDESGRGAGAGRTINVPLVPGAGRDELIAAMEERLVPAAEQFRPDLVLISAGFDVHESERIAMFRLEASDFADLTEKVLEIARGHAEGRVVSVLEGGYSLEGLAAGTAAHVKALTRA